MWVRRREGEQTNINMNNVEVCEFDSMPRIALKAVGKYISKGTSFDIGTMDPNGNPWDFAQAK